MPEINVPGIGTQHFPPGTKMSSYTVCDADGTARDYHNIFVPPVAYSFPAWAYPPYAPAFNYAATTQPYGSKQEKSTKRRREDEENESPSGSDPLSPDDYASEEESEVEVLKWDCSQIRSKINALIRSGEMKVTHFQREIGVTSNSYTNFMKAKGLNGGMNSSTYDRAHRYFRKRDTRGIKMPKAKKAKASDVAKFDVDDIDLDGERHEDVPVYDNCDEVRRKIQAHLREPGVTQAGFGRQIAKTFADGRGIQGKQIADFLKKKGESSGAESCVYYASYVFFEKVRVKNGAKKSNARKNAQREYPGGRELRDRKHEWVWTGPRLPR